MKLVKVSRKKSNAKKAKPVTMRDIAAYAEVSIGTVSHVINGTAGVRPEVARRVNQAMSKLGYQRSQIARSLRRNETNMLGMIVPDITNPFFPLVVRGVEDTAYREGYRLVLCNADNDPGKEEKYLEDLLAYNMAGLIVIPSVDSRILSILKETRRDNRVICVDRTPAEWNGDSVVVDNEEGAYKAVRYLIGMGHRCIATITGPLHVTNAIQRLDGYKRALAEAGIELASEYIQEGRFERISGYQKAQTLLRLLPRPTAIFASNDLIALGILAALREARMPCPDEMSVVGFDDLDVTFFTDPPLTTVAQPAYQLGTKAATLLLSRLRGEIQGRQLVTLPTELRIRQSVKPIEATVTSEFLTRSSVR